MQAMLSVGVLLVVLGTTVLQAAQAKEMTCGDLKAHYKAEQCCGAPEKELSKVPGASAATPCPAPPAKPSCSMAEPQAPRDLSTGAEGQMDPKAATLNDAQAKHLPQANVHFHLGAEHKSDAYSDDTDSKAYDAAAKSTRQRQLEGEGSFLGERRLGAKVRPGFMCPRASLTADQLKPYTFKYCKGEMEVGKSYEVHYVHSSAGYDAEHLAGATDIDLMDDGLGGAAVGRGILNPMIVVQGQVFQIVNGGATVDDMVHGWTVVAHNNSVMYPGSTTGQSHDNSVCSPYTITWHVDKDCHQVSPESFDNMCKVMKETYKLEADLYPHGSRIILDPKYVVKSKYVLPLA